MILGRVYYHHHKTIHGCPSNFYEGLFLTGARRHLSTPQPHLIPRHLPPSLPSFSTPVSLRRSQHPLPISLYFSTTHLHPSLPSSHSSSIPPPTLPQPSHHLTRPPERHKPSKNNKFQEPRSRQGLPPPPPRPSVHIQHLPRGGSLAAVTNIPVV